MNTEITEALVELTRLGWLERGAPTTIAMPYKEWKALGGCDLPGAESGGGFVWCDENGAEYVYEPKY